MSDQVLVEELRATLHREIGALRDGQNKTTTAVNDLKTSIALLMDRFGAVADLKARVRALELSQARMFGAAAMLGALSGGVVAKIVGTLGA